MKNIKTPAPLREVEEIVCRVAGITVYDLYNKGRTRRFSHVRSFIWTIAHLHLGYPLTVIGSLYKKHHTTVLMSVKKAQKQKEMLETIGKFLRANSDLVKRAQYGSLEMSDWDFES